jgi:hypothetical protein
MGTEQSPEEHTMHRLPTCDSRASRVERGIFLSLALSAVALIAMTAWHGLQFASARDQILAPLTEVATKNDSGKQTQSTNLTIYRPSRVGDKDRPGVAERPKS